MRLDEIATKIGSGATPTGGAEAYLKQRNQFALIRSQNVFDRRFDPDGLAFISDAQASALRGVVVQPGDLLLNITGDGITFARCCAAPEALLPACVNQHVAIIRVDPARAHPGYVLAYLTHPQVKAYIESFNAGGSRRAITKGHIESFRLPLPPLAEQKAIARVLDLLDEKIIANTQMNRTLDGLARSIFGDWFLAFGPTRAMARGEKPASIGKNLSAFFPPAFEHSPVGPIPKGWRVEPLAEHVDIERGLSYDGDGLREDGTGLPMHNLNSIYEGGGYKHDGIKFFSGTNRDKHLILPGDMIVANTEQGFDRLLIGHAAIVPARFGQRTIFSHHLYRVRPAPGSPMTTHYLVQLFNSERWHYWISGFANGTTVNMLPKDALQMPLIVIPPEELVQAFTEIAQALHQQSEANLLESRTLDATRDLLGPPLVSGEIGVSEQINPSGAAH
ncbi:MAG: restriction endonuclease subunit S [Acidobacteriota bacterium]|nr:restriction endonuclease subunit S [Acidobacteriota bacterium]